MEEELLKLNSKVWGMTDVENRNPKKRITDIIDSLDFMGGRY